MTLCEPLERDNTEDTAAANSEVVAEELVAMPAGGGMNAYIGAEGPVSGEFALGDVPMLLAATYVNCCERV